MEINDALETQFQKEMNQWKIDREMQLSGKMRDFEESKMREEAEQMKLEQERMEE